MTLTHTQSRRGVAVLDVKRVQHISSEANRVALCGAAWVAIDMHWATTTRLHCTQCLELLTHEPPRNSGEGDAVNGPTPLAGGDESQTAGA